MSFCVPSVQPGLNGKNGSLISLQVYLKMFWVQLYYQFNFQAAAADEMDEHNSSTCHGAV